MKPNIVIIMTDQQTPQLRRAEGYPLDTTPFLDQLASEGADFRKAYTSSPICVAARVSLFTGRFPSANRVKSNYNDADAFYTKDMVDVFRGNGYDFWHAGKNHSHLREDRMDRSFPVGHGGGSGADRTKEEVEFDTFLRGLKHMTYTQPTPFPLECQGPYRIVSKVQEWIEAREDKPFLLWLSFAEPHNPYQVPEPYYSMFPPESLPPLTACKEDLLKKSFPWRFARNVWEQAVPNFDDHITRTRSNYHGMLRLIDDQIMRLVNILDSNELLDNTLLVFLSDHGDFVGEYGLIRKGPEMPDRLMRIPMILKGPHVPKSLYQDKFVSIVDIFPTLCEICEVPIPIGVQGRSLLPLFLNESIPEMEFDSVYAEQGFGGLFYTSEEAITPEEEGVFNDGCTVDELSSWTQSGTMRMVRKDDWKLIFDARGQGQLYNIKEDPMEMNDLFDIEDGYIPTIQKELTETLLTWILKTQDVLPLPQRRYRIKRADHNYTTVEKGYLF